MDRKLDCRFVGYGEKAEKSPYSSAPSCPLGTICNLIGLTLGSACCSASTQFLGGSSMEPSPGVLVRSI
ncbi:hypothetical protein C9417_12950 [Rhizobium sp. SEMIA 4088]|nr:hypothetical protein C9417_12950 [Rhizobium sp. SEMIA 4088]